MTWSYERRLKSAVSEVRGKSGEHGVLGVKEKRVSGWMES